MKDNWRLMMGRAAGGRVGAWKRRCVEAGRKRRGAGSWPVTRDKSGGGGGARLPALVARLRCLTSTAYGLRPSFRSRGSRISRLNSAPQRHGVHGEE